MLERGANHPEAYKSMTEGLAHVYSTRGLRGLWAGFVPSTLGVAHGAVQFAIYERLKQARGQKLGGSEKLSNWDFIYMSGGSKLLAGASTYPYQPIRARMQQYDAASKYNGLLDVLKKTLKNEGFFAFYKGFELPLLKDSMGKLTFKQSCPKYTQSYPNYHRHVCCI
jgi:primary-amine oxidase